MVWNIDRGIGRVGDASEFRWIWVDGGEGARRRFWGIWTLLALLILLFVCLCSSLLGGPFQFWSCLDQWLIDLRLNYLLA